MVSQPYEIEGQQVVVGVSIGIAMSPADGVLPDQLIRNADLALYQAKAAGRNALRFFEPAMDAQIQARRAVEHDLRNAVANQEFELYFQPLVNLERNEIYWSAETFRILGFDLTDSTPGFDEFLARVHPEDRPETEEAMRHLLIAPPSGCDEAVSKLRTSLKV